MRFGRRKQKPPGRRSRVRSEEPTPTTAFSYHAQRSEHNINTGRQLSGAQLREKGRRFGRFWTQRFGLFILLAAAVFSAVNVLSLSASVKIVPLNDGRAEDVSLLRDPTAYAQTAQQFLATSKWNRMKLTADTRNLDRVLTGHYAELANVSVVLPLLAHKPIVYLRPAKPVLILATTHGSYVLSSTGKALIMTDNLKNSQGLDLPTVTDHSNLGVTINHQALPAKDIDFMSTVLGQLKSAKVGVSSLELPSGASEFAVHLVGQPYYVRFNLESGSGRQQAGTFLATQAQLVRQQITPTTYIDVRVDGRAYYK